MERIERKLEIAALLRQDRQPAQSIRQAVGPRSSGSEPGSRGSHHSSWLGPVEDRVAPPPGDHR